MERRTLDQLESLIAESDATTRMHQIVHYEQVFHDQQAAYYDEMYSDPEPVRTYMRRLNEEIFELVRGAEFIVDLCAGTGKSSLPLLERGVQVVAVDVSQEMLRIYRRKAKGRKGLTLVNADATDPPLPENSCPAVIMIGGLHHIPNRELALANACRVLQSGGILIIHEPVITGRSHWLVPVIRNFDAITNLPRVARALARRLGLSRRQWEKPSDRLYFTPFERSFTSVDELVAMVPDYMQRVDLRSKLVLSDYQLGPHLRWVARPLGGIIVRLDDWLSRTGRAGWTGNALWGVFRKT